MILLIFLQLPVVIHILRLCVLASRCDQVQRRHGNINVPIVDQLRNEAVEKCKEQRIDMTSVDIRIGHQYDLVIAELRDIKVIAVSL